MRFLNITRLKVASLLVSAGLFFSGYGCQKSGEAPKNKPAASGNERNALYEAPFAEAAPELNGLGDEEAWSKAEWAPLDQRWLGEEYTPEDFSGRYKLLWTEDHLYLLVEVVDDVLLNQHENPYDFY